jgi:hypothetical protein
MKKLAIAILVIFVSFTCRSADLNLSGFGTLAGGAVVDGDGYIADYPNLGVYDDGFDIGQETRLGLQGTAKFDDKLSATLQVMTRASNDFELEVEWLYATLKVADGTNLQAGRMRMPVYYYSEYMDVGYAFPWVRIPADAYSLDATNFNGIKLNHNFSSGETDFMLSLYTGKEDNPNDELMSYLFESFTTRIDREFDDILGIVFDISRGNFSARVTQTQANMLETQTYFDASTADIPFDIEFFDIFLRYNFESGFSIMAEYNKYKPFYQSYFTSLIYQIDDIAYYLNWSQFDLDTPFEKHDTTSLGVRLDIGSGYALKIDVSAMNDEGFNPFTGQPNPVYHADPDGNGDVTVVSFALDFVF